MNKYLKLLGVVASCAGAIKLFSACADSDPPISNTKYYDPTDNKTKSFGKPSPQENIEKIILDVADKHPDFADAMANVENYYAKTQSSEIALEECKTIRTNCDAAEKEFQKNIAMLEKSVLKVDSLFKVYTRNY